MRFGNDRKEGKAKEQGTVTRNVIDDSFHVFFKLYSMIEANEDIGMYISLNMYIYIYTYDSVFRGILREM